MWMCVCAYAYVYVCILQIRANYIKALEIDSCVDWTCRVGGVDSKPPPPRWRKKRRCVVRHREIQLGAGCARVSPAGGEGEYNYPEVPIIKNGSCASLSCHVVPGDKHYGTLVAIASSGGNTRMSIVVICDIFIQLETTCRKIAGDV